MPFAHGSGSSRFRPRNRYLANHLVEGGLGTLLFDLLTTEEEVRDQRDASLRFDIDLLARRLAGATPWLGSQGWAANLWRGYFGTSTGAAAALVANVECEVHGIVSRGGRPDLKGVATPAMRSAREIASLRGQLRWADRLRATAAAQRLASPARRP